jgi:hypothetical protein
VFIPLISFYNTIDYYVVCVIALGICDVHVFEWYGLFCCEVLNVRFQKNERKFFVVMNIIYCYQKEYLM